MSTAGWPRGTVAFLFTDVEGSTALWERHPEAMPAAYARHDAILRAAVEQHGGVLYKVIGGACQAAFSDAPAAVAAALSAQVVLRNEEWAALGLPEPIRVRMALHLGAVDPDSTGDYRSPVLNRLGRLLAAAHGGQVLVSEAVAEAVADRLPAGARWRDLGQRRLRDLPRTERIRQLVAAGLPRAFPQLRTEDGRRGDVAAAPNPLIGRAVEVAAVEDAIEVEGARLITLVGPGGVGKTRLAAAAAAGLIDCFADGVVFVSLAALSDASLAPAVVASRLGVTEEPGRSLHETLSEWLADRGLLLLLDNCEQVRAGIAATMERWLETAPRLTVLATSRVRLGSPRERVVVVEPLAIPTVGPTVRLDAVRAAPAGALFLDRAAAVRAEAIAGDDAPAIARACALLDGLPLAIELAAARLDEFSPREVVERLERRLPELVDGPRDLPARQRTLRDAIAWSHDLLDGEARVAFRRLSVFAGGGATESVAVVVDRPPAVLAPALDDLVAHSLLRRERDGDEERYVMLETIREFGLERLADEDDAAAAQRRHALAIVELVEHAEPRLLGEEQARWFARLQREQANLRAALTFALDVEKPPAADVALRLGGALWRFWDQLGQLSEGRAWIEQGLAVGAAAPAPVRAKALNAIGTLTLNQGDLSQARERYEESLALWRDLGDTAEVARALNNLGTLLQQQGDERAEDVFAEAVDHFRALGDDWRTASVLNNQANGALLRGDLDRATGLLEEALILFRRIGDQTRAATILTNLGILAQEQGDLGRASALHSEALAGCRESGFVRGIGIALENLGAVGVGPGGPRPRAAALFGESLANRHETGDRVGSAQSLVNLGQVALGQGRLVPAVRLLAAGLTLRDATGNEMMLEEDRAAIERGLAEARRQLDPVTFSAAWEAGRALTLVEAVAEGLAIAAEPAAAEPPRA